MKIYTYMFNIVQNPMRISSLMNQEVDVVKLRALEQSQDDNPSFIIAEAIINCGNLTFLDVGENNLEPEDSKTLVNALSNCKSLETFLLDMNRLGDSGIDTLFPQILTNNSRLTELCIAANNISEKGLDGICSPLLANHPIQRLELACNIIGDGGVQKLCAALRNNENLIELNLEYCEISNIGAQALIDLLQVNHTLMEVNVKDCFSGIKRDVFIDYELQKKIETSCNTNSQIIEALHLGNSQKALSLINKKQGLEEFPSLFQITGLFVKTYCDPSQIARDLPQDIQEKLDEMPSLG